jgi:hypothetical protein
MGSSGSASRQISLCRGDKIKKPLKEICNPPEALSWNFKNPIQLGDPYAF